MNLRPAGHKLLSTLSIQVNVLFFFCLFVCFSSCLNFYFSACPNCFLVLTFFTDYKEVFKVQIDRKNRSLGRIFKRQPVKFEVKYERYGLVALPIFINTSFLVSGRPVFAGCCADNQRGRYIPPESGDQLLKCWVKICSRIFSCQPLLTDCGCEWGVSGRRGKGDDLRQGSILDTVRPVLSGLQRGMEG